MGMTVESVARLPIRTLHWLEIPDTQECDLLCVSGAEADATTEMLNALLTDRGAWDKLQLGKLDRASVAYRLLPALLDSHELHYRLAQPDANMFIDLVGDWEGYQSSLTRSFKKKLNLARNRLAKLGESRVVRFGGAASEASAETAFQALTEVSAKSWKRQTDTTLDRPGPAAFASRLAARFGDSGQLQVWLLRLDGRVVATELQLCHERNVHALRSDFDPELEDASPGTNLSVEILRRLFTSHQGGRYLMGAGANAYKRRWTDKALPLYELTVYSPTARGRTLYMVEQKVRPIARGVRDLLRKSTARDGTARPDDE